MIYIYALIDPFTKSIRYVGKSIRPKQRLQNHCNEKSVTYRTNWIQSVIAKGGKPEMAILEVLENDADWAEAERKWITYGKDSGWSLTNCTDGGDGVPNLPLEIRQRMAKSWIGRKHKPESIKKIGEASKGRTHTLEYKEMMRHIMTGREVTWGDKLSKVNRKLSDEQVREIRQLIAVGVSQYIIAEQYGVHQGTISNIRRGVSYSDVFDADVI